MLWQPSTNYRYAFKKGMRGTDVAALQLNLGELVVDGDFGPATKARVLDFQGKNSLIVDGIAGGATQTALCQKLTKSPPELPGGFLKSIMANESGFYVAAVSQHPSDPGLDVGAFQRSTGKALGSQDFYASAYDVAKSAQSTAQAAIKFHDAVPHSVSSQYLTELADGDTDHFAWQMTVLNHNWPAAAHNIPRTGHALADASADDKPATWIETATNGTLHTPREWIMAYIQKATVYVVW